MRETLRRTTGAAELALMPRMLALLAIPAVVARAAVLMRNFTGTPGIRHKAETR
jgi:hypothetical protein